MDKFTTEAFTLLAVGSVVVGLRCASRLCTVGFRGLWADDYLMLLALVVYALETATAYAVGAWWHGLANNGMTDEQRRLLDVNSQEYHFRVAGSKTQLVGWSLYTLLLWLLKLCMCIFYDRLTRSLDYMRMRLRIGYAVVGVTYIATIASILGGCQPFHHNWQIFPDPGNHCQPAISRIDLYVTVVLNVLSDAYLLSIPLPLLWKADVPLFKKLSLILVFSGAIFVMAAGVLRCALIITDPVGGAQAAGSWAVRETFVAVVVSNLPIVYQGYRALANTAAASSISSRIRSLSHHSRSHSRPDSGSGSRTHSRGWSGASWFGSKESHRKKQPLGSRTGEGEGDGDVEHEDTDLDARGSGSWKHEGELVSVEPMNLLTLNKASSSV